MIMPLPKDLQGKVTFCYMGVKPIDGVVLSKEEEEMMKKFDKELKQGFQDMYNLTDDEFKKILEIDMFK